MAIVKYKNQSGTTYAYESISEWDPVKKQSRPKRKYLGRVDEETGEIISTAGRRGRPRKNPVPETPSESNAATNAGVEELTPEEMVSLERAQGAINHLKEENARLSEENQRLKEILSAICQQAASAIEQA